MASLSTIAGSLARWARDDGARTAQLDKWRTEAIEKAASNQGAHIRSGSAHGISFQAADGLTWADWLAVLDQALLINSRNVAAAARSVASFAP